MLASRATPAALFNKVNLWEQTAGRRRRHMTTNPLSMFAGAWEGRRLIVRLAQREIEARYRGSLLGWVWLVLLPLFMLGVYTFAFAVVFKARWGGTEGGTASFSLLLFSGLTIFALFADTVNRAPTLVLENPSYVKKVVFPLELLPWVALCVSGFNAAVSFALLLAIYPFVFGAPPLTVLLVPLTLLPLALMTLGLSWLLASIGVFLRDVRPVVGVLTTGTLFLSPIFYPVSAVPVSAQWLLGLNPLTRTLEQARAALFWGKAPDPLVLSVQMMIGLAIAWLGYAWFQRTRKAFADVI